MSADDFCWSSNEEEFNSEFEEAAFAAWDSQFPINWENIEGFEVNNEFTLWRGVKLPFSAKDFFPDVDWVLTETGEGAYGEVFDASEEWLSELQSNTEHQKELKESLERVFDEWATKHGYQPRFYGVGKISEVQVKQTSTDVHNPVFEIIGS